MGVELFCALALLAGAGFALAAPVPAPPATEANQTGVEQGTVAFSPGVDEVEQMVAEGVDEEVIKAYIQNAPIAYALTSSEIIALQKRGVPSGLLLAMLLRGGELRSRATSAQPAAQAAVSVPAPAVHLSDPVAGDSDPIQAVYPAYLYDYPGYEVYPSPNYVSVGFNWGRPWYGYGWGGPPYRRGWPGSGYPHGRTWSGYVHGSAWSSYRHGGAWNNDARHGNWNGDAHPGAWNSDARHGAWSGSRSSAPIRHGASQYAAPPHAGSAAHGGYAAPRSSGSFHSTGRGGGFYRGR